jgi:transglutaminase-like putative cysteine protease
MNLRLTALSAFAVLLASLSLSALIAGDGWLVAEIGALIVVGAAGMLTRSTSLASAVTTTFLVLIGVIPLLSGPSWAGRIGGIAIVVVTAASAAGSRFRAISVIACYLASLLIYLNLVFAHGYSYGAIIPSNQSAAELGRLCQQAFAEFKYQPPVPISTGLSLVVAGGVGLVAIIVDLLAVRLRQPAVAGLPLLVLFSVPVASNLKTFSFPQMAVFAAALAGYLALLSAEGRDRLRMWGRLVTFRHVQSADEAGSGPDTRDLAASGRRIGLAAVCLAVAIPLIVPSLHTKDVFATTADGNGFNGHGGHGGGTNLSPLLQVTNELQTTPQQVLDYTTTSSDPKQQYLQQFVLNYRTSINQWTQLPLSGAFQHGTGQLPVNPPGVLKSTPADKVTTTVHVSSTYGGNVLPAPYAPVDLDAGSGWQESNDSLMLFNDSAGINNRTYTVTSEVADPSYVSIPDKPAPKWVENEYGTYKGPYAKQLTAIAKSVTAGATTPARKAYDLEYWFSSSGDFTYTLKPDLPSGASWLWTFVKQSQQGYCTQFAWAFAVMGRLLGLPTRIVVGYTAGNEQKGGVWSVTTADAHAWPEVYFTGEGWLRFEPTPTGKGGQGTAAPPIYAVPGAPGGAPGTAVSPVGPNLGYSGKTGPGRNSKLGDLNGPTGGGGALAHRGSSLWPAVVIPVLVVLLLIWPGATRLLIRRRRWRKAAGDAGMANAAWREVTDDLTDYGFEGPPGETQRGLIRRVTAAARLDAGAAQALNRVGTAAERARYSLHARPADGLRADVLTVRRAVAASVPRRQRLQARLLPPSTLLAAWHVLQRGGDMLAWLDSSWPTLRRQLRKAVRRGSTSLRTSDT